MRRAEKRANQRAFAAWCVATLNSHYEFATSALRVFREWNDDEDGPRPVNANDVAERLGGSEEADLGISKKLSDHATALLAMSYHLGAVIGIANAVPQLRDEVQSFSASFPSDALQASAVEQGVEEGRRASLEKATELGI